MKTIFTCLLVGVVFFVSAQNTFKVRVFGDNFTFDNLSQVIQLDDGSFVGVGTFYPTNGGYKGYLLKTDANGNVLASQVVNAYTTSLTKTADGGFAVCGDYDTSALFIKFKADLTIQWQKHYSPDNVGKFGFENASKILQTPDGGYIIAGIYRAPVSNSGGLSIIKTDTYGNIIFSKSYSTYYVNSLSDMAATNDGNYAFLGSQGSRHDTALITKIKPDGSVLWSRYLYEDNLSFAPVALNATSDGGLALTGVVFDFNASVQFSHGFIAKYNNTGDLLWSKKIVTNDTTSSASLTITEDRDSGYLFGGELDKYIGGRYYNQDSSFGYVIKTNSEGALQWTKKIEPNHGGFSGIENLLKTSDGGYATCGEIAIYNFENGDYQGGAYINKYNSNFEACGEMPESEGSLADTGKSAIVNVIVNDITLITSYGLEYLSDATGTVDNVCSSNALPLQLLSFNATLQNKSVSVNWTTANEINTNYFVVERSRDAIAFTALQQVTAKGNNAGEQTYNTTDLQPLPGTSYYRLKEVDKDGKTTYSSVVPVTVLSSGVIVISPNPVRDVIRVIMQSTANAGITCQVIHMKGTVLATQKASVATGRNEITISASSLSKGMYVLKIIANNTTQTMRFVKE